MPEGQPYSPEQGLEGLTAIQDSMTQLAEGLGENAPPEAMAALKGAISAYSEFLSIIGGGGAQGVKPAAQDAAMAGGQSNAVPVR